MAGEQQLFELTQVLNVEGAQQARATINSFFEGLAADAQKIINRTGGAGGAGEAEAHVQSQVASLRSNLEYQLQQGVRAGQISTGRGGEQETIKRFLNTTLGTIPQTLAQFYRSTQYETQKEVRKAVAQAGSGGGVVPPTLPPLSAGKNDPGGEARPPGRNTGTAAQEYARDQGKAVQQRTKNLQALNESDFAKDQAQNVREGYRLHAAVLGEIASTNEYADAKARASKYLAQTNARTQGQLAIDDEYATARARAARYQAVQNAGVQQQLSLDGTYNRAQAGITRFKAIQQAAQQQILATDDTYNRAQAVATRAKAEQSARLQDTLAGDSRYLAAQANVTRARSRQQATIQEDLATTGEYAVNQARAARAKAEIGAQTQAELASTGEYASAQARATRSKAEISAKVQEELASTGQYAQATARAARARDITARRQAEAQLAPENLQANTARRLAQENLRTNQDVQYNQALLNDPFLQAQQVARTELVEAVKRQRDIALETGRMDEHVLAETAELARLKERRNALESATRLGVATEVGDSTATIQGRVAAREGVVAAERHTARLREMTANDGAILEQMAQQRALERNVNQALEQRVREIRRAATPGGSGILEGGSFFQRIQASIQSRQSGDVVDPQRLMGLGQFIQSRAITTAGFALSGAALYGGVQAIRQMVTESEQLQRIFNQIQAQFQSVGDAKEFSGFRQAMFDISRETGVAASEVATVGFQMKGAFGDTTEAVNETRDAIKVAVVTGLPQKELTDSLTAAAKAYKVSIADIGDEAIGLEERFGVLSQESLKVFGDMASVAREAGLSLKELGAIIGTIQQASGRPGSSIAEALGRVLPGIQSQELPILQEYTSNPALQGSSDAVRSALASGQTGQVLVQLLRDWRNLDQTTKNYFLTLLGGRREAATLIPLFNNTSEAINEMDRTQSDSGKTSERFADIQTTLAQAVARFRAEFVNLGNDLVRAGVLDVLRDIAVAGGASIRVMDLMVRAFSAINDVTGSIPGRIAAITLAVIAITKAIDTFNKVRTSGIFTRILGGGAGGAVPDIAEETTASGLILPAGVVLGGETAAARTGLLSRIAGSGPGAAVGGFFARQGAGTYLESLGIGAGAAGALTIGGAAVTSLVAERAWNQRSNVQSQLQSERQRVERSFANSSLASLTAARDRGDFNTSLTDRIGLFGTGQTPIGTLANREINRQTLAQVEEAKKNGLLSAFSDKDLQALRDNKGGGPEGARARELIAQLPQEQQKKLQDAVGAAGQQADTVEDILKNGGQKIAQTMQDLQAQFQAGEIGSEEYLAGLQQQLELVRSVDTTPETHTKLLEIQRQINTEFTQRTVQGLQALQKLQQQAGLDAGAILPFARAVLNQGRETVRVFEAPTRIVPPGTLNPPIDIRPNIVPNLAPNLDITHPIFPAGQAGPLTPEDLRGAYSQGQTVTPPRQLSPEEAFGAANIIVDAQKQAWLDNIARAPDADTASQLLRNPPKLDAETADAIKKYYKDKYNLDVDPTIGPTFDQISQQRQRALQEAVGAIQLAGAGSRDPAVQAATAARVAAAQLASARNPGVDAQGNPIAVNKGEVDAALAAQKEAGAQALDVARGIDDAKTDLLAAQHPDDILAQARAQQAKAATAAKYAQGQAAQLEAEAQRLAADRQMEDALNAITDSRIKLLQTHMSLAGDEIGAAEQGVQLAQNALDRARDRGASEDVINELQGQLDTQKDQVRETTLQNREDIINFNLQMERITIGQAISQLEALMSIANPKEQRDLLLRIKALRDQAGQDLQFNIPSEIKLPTLYEVRRALQTPEGQGYNDNRNVSVVMHVNNGMDQAAATRWLSSTIGTAPRVVTRGRRV